MTRDKFLCRTCGSPVAVVTGTDVRLLGVDSTHYLKRRRIVVVCPTCGNRRAIDPPRHVETVTTVKPP